MSQRTEKQSETECQVDVKILKKHMLFEKYVGELTVREICRAYKLGWVRFLL